MSGWHKSNKRSFKDVYSDLIDLSQCQRFEEQEIGLTINCFKTVGMEKAKNRKTRQKTFKCEFIT